MSQQMNFYLNEKDIQKIENYLKNHDFLFVEDIEFASPKIVQTAHLLDNNFQDRYIFFKDSELHFRLLSNQSFQIEEQTSTLLEMNYMGFVEGLFRFRLYYNSVYFEDEAEIEKNPEFGKAVEAFFEWLRTEFSPVPQLSAFYQNPEFPTKKIF